MDSLVVSWGTRGYPLAVSVGDVLWDPGQLGVSPTVRRCGFCYLRRHAFANHVFSLERNVSLRYFSLDVEWDTQCAERTGNALAKALKYHSVLELCYFCLCISEANDAALTDAP